MGNNPQEFVDPFGESIVGKVCVLGAKGLAKALGKVGKKEAVDALKQGDDVIFKSRKEAQEAAKAAGGGKQPIHEIDKKTGNGHYHLADRSGGHAIYENTKFFAGALTFDYYAKDAKAGPLVQKAAEGLDLINPLSLGQDAFDVYDAFSGDSCQ